MEKKKSVATVMGNVFAFVLVGCLMVCGCGALIALTVKFLTIIF